MLLTSFGGGAGRDAVAWTSGYWSPVRRGFAHRRRPLLDSLIRLDADRSGRIAFCAMEFADHYGPWALVAGASEGVGASVARLLGQRGINVVLVSRREVLLREVAETVPSSTRRVVLDLSEPTAGDELRRTTADLEIGLLIYIAGADPNMSRFLDKPLNVWQAMLTRNCGTVMASAYHFGGHMVRRGHGGLVLVTSGASWAGGSHLAAYGATKAFNLILGESLWAEFAVRRGSTSSRWSWGKRTRPPSVRCSATERLTDSLIQMTWRATCWTTWPTVPPGRPTPHHSARYQDDKQSSSCPGICPSLTTSALIGLSSRASRDHHGSSAR